MDGANTQTSDGVNKISIEELEALKEKLQQLIEAGPDIDSEQTGFPVGAFKGSVVIGKAIPINKRNWSNIEITAEDSILDCPSQVVPLVIKKPNIFPPKLPEDEDELRYRRPKKVSDDQTGEGQNDNADGTGEGSDGDGPGDDFLDEEDGQGNENEFDGEHEEDENGGRNGDGQGDGSRMDLNGTSGQQPTPNTTINSTSNNNSAATASTTSTPNPDQPSQPKRRGRKPKYMTEDPNLNQELITTPSNSSMLILTDYYNSSPGNLLLSIGLSRAKEWVHRDAIKQLHKAIRKQGELEEYVDDMKRQQAMYQACKAANSIFVSSEPKRCHLCDFKSDTEAGLEYHLSIPHLSPKREYKCNFCQFATRDAKAIQEHYKNLHNKPCIVEAPPQLYECCICPYESSQKQKAAAHLAKCLKFFNAEKVQQIPDLECDYPAITPKPITQMDIKIYDVALKILQRVVSTPGMTVPDIPGLPKGLVNQMLVMTQQQYAASLAKSRQAALAKKNQPQNSAGPGGATMKSGSTANMPSAAMAMAKSTAPHLFHMLQGGPGGHTQLVQVPPGQKGAVPSSSLLNRQAMKHRQMIGPNVVGAMKNPAYGTQATGANKVDAGRGGTFVICEICDGYIKDLEQLRTHMQWIHKVKIQPKMLASRPPLNCQKCQWRFFTDQGLERHLLGAHGLVTTNMQDMVNQNSDCGRCTVCGRVFSNKLVAHMNQTHKITLKPAHLSYKCTVCSATFNLYRLFESHVYKVHSGPTRKSSNSGPTSNDHSKRSGENDSSDHQEPPAKKAKLHPSHENNTNQNGLLLW